MTKYKLTTIPDMAPYLNEINVCYEVSLTNSSFPGKMYQICIHKIHSLKFPGAAYE